MQAIWKNQVIAESDATVVVEGNHYFPPESINAEFFQDSEKRSSCFWKGKASYKDIVVNGETNKNAAWNYLEPKARAENIKGYFAFWRGVEIV